MFLMSADALHSSFLEEVDVNLASYGALVENSMDAVGPQENIPCTYMGASFMDADIFSKNVTSTESTICQSSDGISDFADHRSAMQYCMSTDNTLVPDFSWNYLPRTYGSPFSLGNHEMMANMKDEVGEFSNDSACSSSKMMLDVQREMTGRSVSDVPYSDVNGWNFKYEGNHYMSSLSGNSSSDVENCTQSYMSSKNQATFVKNEVTDELIAPSCHSMEVIDEAVSRKSCSADAKDFVDRDLNQSSDIFYSTLSQAYNYTPYEKNDISASKRACYSEDVNEIASRSLIDGAYLSVSASEKYFPCAQPSTSCKMQLDCFEDESVGRVVQSKSMDSHFSRVCPELSCNNFSDISHVEDDSDICIIEDMSHPPPTTHPPAIGNSLITSQGSTFSDSHYYTGVGGTRIKSRDERLILRVALQVSSFTGSSALPALSGFRNMLSVWKH